MLSRVLQFRSAFEIMVPAFLLITALTAAAGANAALGNTNGTVAETAENLTASEESLQQEVVVGHDYVSVAYDVAIDAIWLSYKHPVLGGAYANVAPGLALGMMAWSLIDRLSDIGLW